MVNERDKMTLKQVNGWLAAYRLGWIKWDAEKVRELAWIRETMLLHG